MSQQAVLINIAALVILIALSAYFSAAETAFSTVNRVSLKTLADDGNKRAALALKVLEQYSKMLSAILICNNVVNLSASSLATTVIIGTLGTNAVSIGTAVLTVLIILFGEITPKNVSKVRAQQISMRDAKTISMLMTVLTPVIFIIDHIAGGLLKMMGVDVNKKQLLTENELKTYVEVGREDGVIENREKKIIYNVFDFGDSEARDIMVPRIDMCCVSSDATYDEVMDTFRKEMFTRIPVYESDNQDKIIGHLNIKDFILQRDPKNFSVKKFLHESYYTYEYKKTAELLRQMQQNSYGVAFVIDEYGNTVGMITLEDLIEEIVGDIRDEYDRDEEKQLRKYDDLTWLVDGSMNLDDVNDAIGSHFESEDYDSIGGLMIEQLERLPANGETVTLEDGTTLTAKGIRHNRIMKVLIRLAAPAQKEESSKDSKKGNGPEEDTAAADADNSQDAGRRAEKS